MANGRSKNPTGSIWIRSDRHSCNLEKEKKYYCYY